MVKILSQSGISLSSVYNVKGSVVGIDELQAQDGISLVHELGATIFSERLSGFIRRLTTGAIAASDTFDVTISNLPVGASRVLGVYVQTDASARIDRCQVSLRSAVSGREIPIFIWSALDAERNIRIVENDAAVTNRVVLLPTWLPTMPSLLIGGQQPQQVGEEIVLRGVATAFGAGTITLVALVYLGFSQAAGLSSHGLPIPGW